MLRVQSLIDFGGGEIDASHVAETKHGRSEGHERRCGHECRDEKSNSEVLSDGAKGEEAEQERETP